MWSKIVLFGALLAVGKAQNAALQSFNAGNLKFTSKIYEIIAANPGNFMVSPISAEIILALTSEGAKGQTKSQLVSGLSLPTPDSQLQNAISQLLKAYTSTSQYKLETANKIYVQKNFCVKKQFLDVATTVYKSGIQTVDFADSVATVDLINAWVANQTEDKIQNLLSSDSVNAATRMVLVNCLYMHANWTIPFKSTQQKPFYVSSTKTVQVPTMLNKGWFNYTEDSIAQFLELNYNSDNQQITMTIVLPKSGKTLTDLDLSTVFTRPNYSVTNVNIELPSWLVETSIDFTSVLKQLGVTTIFTSSADLSGIAGNPGDLAVTSVVQKTFINVTETGTTAAAATAVVVGITSVVDPPPQLKYFIANRPFLYYIKVNKAVVFAGRTSDPSA